MRVRGAGLSVVVGLVGSLLVGVGVSGATQAAAVASLSAKTDGGSAGEDASVGVEESAVAEAVRTGRRVEVEALRTETSQTFADPSGRLVLEQGLVPERVRRDGAWVSVDPTLVRAGDGSVVPRAAALGVRLSGGGSAPLFTVRAPRGDAEVALVAPFALPAPVLSGSTATYPEVLAGVDLVVRVGAESVSEVLVVKSAEAARQSALSALRFATRTSDASLRESSSGGVELVDTLGNVVLDSPQPMMWDSSGTPDEVAVSGEATSVVSGSFLGASLARSALSQDAGTLSLSTRAVSEAGSAEPVVAGDASAEFAETSAESVVEGAVGPDEGDVVAGMGVEVTSSALTVVPDRELLRGEDTVYPLFIDPAFAPKRSLWTYVNKTYPNEEYGKFDDTNGQGAGYSTWDGVNTKRIFYMFRTSSMNGKVVEKATLNAWATHSYSCTPGTTAVHRTGDISSATNWNNQPKSYGVVDTATTTRRTGCGNGKEPGWVTFTVTKAVRTTTGAGRTYTTLSLRAGSESDITDWKRFRHTAKLSITYNTPVKTPTKLTMTDPETDCSEPVDDRPRISAADPPTLRARVSDADGSDGQNLGAEFELYKWNATAQEYRFAYRLVTADKDVKPNDYGDFSWNTESVRADRTLPEGSWRWRVRGYDPFTKSAWAGASSAMRWCFFRTDATPPSKPPTVTAAEDNVYEVGRTISLTLGNNGISDVASYQWSLNGGTWTGTGPALSLALTHFGPNQLRLRSVDQAGNKSVATALTVGEAPGLFLVGGQALPRDRWKLDEGSGTTAADMRPTTQNYSDPWTTVTANALTLTGGTAWGVGRRDDLDAGEHVLVFDGVNDAAATTATGVVDASRNWSVAAWLKVAPRKGRQVAVSLDSGTRSGMSLGVESFDTPDPEDPESVERNYRFVAEVWDPKGGEAGTGAFVTLRGSGLGGDQLAGWFHVTVSYTASSRQVNLWIHTWDRFSTGDITFPEGESSDWQAPLDGAVEVMAASMLPFDGRVHLGKATSGTVATIPWAGMVDEVQVFRGAFTEDFDSSTFFDRMRDPR